MLAAWSDAVQMLLQCTAVFISSGTAILVASQLSKELFELCTNGS